jgi:hypothetical protein
MNAILDEVKILLEGMIVGGYRSSDQTITLNQAASWKEIACK